MVINIFLKNNLAASLHIALFPSSPVTDLDKDKPASRLLFILTQMKKTVSHNTSFIFQEMQVWFIWIGQKAAKRCSSGRIIDLLTSNPRPLQSQKSLQSDERLSWSDNREKPCRFSRGKKAKAALWVVMMPRRVHFHAHSPHASRGGRHNNLKSWTSGGGSLKSTAVFSFKVNILLNWQ